MKRIISIHDSLPTQTLIDYTLSRQGHDVTRLFNEKDALDSLNHNSFDLIVVNITSEKIGWATLLGNIRNDSRHAETPVLALTNKYCEEKAKKATELGVNDFLSKPFKPLELVGTVSRILEG